MSDTQTYCFGRFLIDLPKTGELIAQTSGFMFGEIETGRTPPKQNIHQNGFVEMMKAREAALRETKKKWEYTFADARLSGNPKSRILVTSRPPLFGGDKAYGFEAYRFDGGALFSMKESTFGPDKIDSVLQRLETRLLPNLRARRPDEIPSEPGFCIEEGFIADDGQTPQYEFAELSIKFKQWPDTRARLRVTRSGQIKPSLLTRRKEKPIPAVFAEMAKKIKTLRQGKRDVGPLQGEENLAALPTDDGYFTHHFVWDTQGKPDSVTEPAFYFELDTGFIVGANNPDVRPSLTDQQAIKLFDAIVNSIRLRPTTPGKTSDAGGPNSPNPATPKRLPLGTKVSSLRSCPETGVYECPPAAPGVTDRRVYLAQGRPMPGAFILVPKRGIAGFFGGQESKEVETTWTLAAYEQDA